MSQRPAIRHVVFFSAKDPADVARIIEGLSLLADIPHSDVFEVRRNIRDDALSGEADVVVYAEFASAEALTAYKAHPTLFRHCPKTFVRCPQGLDLHKQCRWG